MLFQYICWKKRKRLLKCQYFGQVKIEFGQGKVSEKSGFLACLIAGSPVTMAIYSFHGFFMGKMKIGIYCYLTADILTKA